MARKALRLTAISFWGLLLSAPTCLSAQDLTPSGIASGGGAGWVLAQWVVSGEAPMDLWVVDIRRFSGLHEDRDWVCERTLEAYGKHYTIGFPARGIFVRAPAHHFTTV